MKRCKLLAMKLNYWFDYLIGPYMTNGRKIKKLEDHLINQEKKIHDLESEIKKNC